MIRVKILSREYLILSLPMSPWEAFADGADQDQTAENVWSDLGSTSSAT